MSRFGACDSWLLRRSCTPPRLPRVHGTSAPNLRIAQVELDPRALRGPKAHLTPGAGRRLARVQAVLRAAPVGCGNQPQARRRQVDVSSGTVMTTVH